MFLFKSETATQNNRVLCVASQTTAINCTKIALKSQLVYARGFEVATSARQKLHRVARQTGLKQGFRAFAIINLFQDPMD